MSFEGGRQCGDATKQDAGDSRRLEGGYFSVFIGSNFTLITPFLLIIKENNIICQNL